jgi:hypothetical protein
MRATLTFVVPPYRMQLPFEASNEHFESKLFHTMFVLLAKKNVQIQSNYRAIL